jgi:hypothetical protein
MQSCSRVYPILHILQVTGTRTTQKCRCHTPKNALRKGPPTVHIHLQDPNHKQYELSTKEAGSFDLHSFLFCLLVVLRKHYRVRSCRCLREKGRSGVVHNAVFLRQADHLLPCGWFFPRRSFAAAPIILICFCGLDRFLCLETVSNVHWFDVFGHRINRFHTCCTRFRRLKMSRACPLRRPYVFACLQRVQFEESTISGMLVLVSETVNTSSTWLTLFWWAEHTLVRSCSRKLFRVVNRRDSLHRGVPSSLLLHVVIGLPYSDLVHHTQAILCSNYPWDVL